MFRNVYRKAAWVATGGLAVFVVITGWGLGAVLDAFAFATLAGPRAAEWLEH